MSHYRIDNVANDTVLVNRPAVLADIVVQPTDPVFVSIIVPSIDEPWWPGDPIEIIDIDVTIDVVARKVLLFYYWYRGPFNDYCEVMPVLAI